VQEKKDQQEKKEQEEKNEIKDEIKEEINLEEIKFKNCQIDIRYSDIFPLIKKLTIKNCKIPYNISKTLNFNFLTHLILEDLNLNDDNFHDLFELIKSNSFLKNNLQLISLKNNNIGLIDPCKGLDDDAIAEGLGLSNLEILDLSNNKIFFITFQMIDALKKIKLIDLTNNGIVFPTRYSLYLTAGKKNLFLVLLTKNYALLNDINKEEYINYLFDVVPKINYEFKSLSFVNLYVGKFYDKMKTLNLSKFNNSLIELDISYGNITDKDLINLLKGNLNLKNLKKLNLSKNKLTEKILDIFTESFVAQFSKLKYLNLSGNKLIFKKAINYQNFFEKFKSLKLFEAKQTPFELSLNNYTKTIINRYYENERYKKYKTDFTNEDLEMEKIVQNDKYLCKKTNITICVFDVNNYKYISKVKKFYPDILERINFEMRLQENK
jgi:Leucine-rich repeat (LRR) protein